VRLVLLSVALQAITFAEEGRSVVAPPAPTISSSLGDTAEVSHGKNSTIVRFTAAEDRQGASVRFQTKLLPGIDEWSAPTENSQLILAGLSDGSYEIAVRAINDAGMTSPTTHWKFTVLPPWYRTKFAFGVWSLLMLAGLFGGVQWRSAYLRGQNAHLVVLVQKKTEQLEKANATKSEFLANMSHEIRNPISGIVGLSLAMEETPLDTRQRELNDSVRSCAALLATLMDDVLDFSNIEAGQIELHPAPFEVRAILEQCTAMIAADIRRSGNAVSIEIDPDVPTRVVGDAARVQQIVLKYLTNALKFAAGGPVTVGAALAIHGRIRLLVRDRGPGISETEAGSLFTKFTRLGQARADNIRGAGLLATKMGGTVGVDSTPGEGACFWADLPLSSATVAAPSTSVVEENTTPLCALIVEDIDYNATAMQAVLRKLGVQSEVATDGPTALARLQSKFYDVAFMDWNLPGMIGTEVVTRYRAIEPPNRRTIIVATTAYSSDLNREACLQAGMDVFIGKPLTPEKVFAALQGLRGSRLSTPSVEVVDPIERASLVSGVELQLLRFLSDESAEGLAGQVKRYLESFDADRKAAREIIAAGDAQEIHRIAHRLGGHAGMVKFEPLMTLARELQASAAIADPAKLSELLAEFDREFDHLKSKLESIQTLTGLA
jgi:signal transduction histidine kinase/CheY-like chemotaxis protein/HPt (histidine-containing phosphotransfer) domain-containing protein